tara:strand:+ start:803 stop:1687 length:885 start_codon:yes stop_codon:yes gene_type:complete
MSSTIQVDTIKDIGGNTIISSNGSGTFTSNLPASGATLTGSTNNTVVTVTGANAIQGESSLTFDGTTLLSTSGASGATANSSANNVVADGNSASGNGISILSKNDSNGGIFFGDAQSNSKCIVKYDHSTDLLKFDTAAATAFSMDQTGAITTVLQPGFSATKSTSSQTVSAAYVDVSFNNEIWDNNADWNGSTTFTAPVTGKYMFSGAIRINDILAQGGSVFGRMGTSNRNYLFGTITDADDIANATIAAYQFQATVIADMDANDTMTMAFFSNFQTTIDNDAERTWLQGYLLG